MKNCDEFDRSLILDGNAAAGDLMEIFGREMTEEPVECSNCGCVQFVGSLMAFAGGPGLVLRCPSCQAVLFCSASLPSIACLDVRWISTSQSDGATCPKSRPTVKQ